jgi:STE24 endopeptidase
MQPSWLPLLLGLYAAEQTADLGLTALNLWWASRARGVPEGLEGLLDPEVAERSRAYAVATGRVALWRCTASAGLTVALLFSGILPWLDLLLHSAVDHPAHHFVLFLVPVTAVLWAADLPFAAWRTFGVERRFGFSRVGPGRFLADRFKAWCVSAAVGVPFLYGIYAVMTLGGPSWWLWLFGLLATFQLGLVWLWPAVVARLFTPQRPLPPGPLRDRLEALASKSGFRPRDILVVEASRRGGHPNAALAGLGRPRILLDDTLLARLNADEVEAVVAHEIGHHRLHHLSLRLAASMLGLLVLLAALAQALQWPALYPAFGFAGPSPHAALALVSICSGAFAFWVSPLQSWLARRQESAADALAVALTGRPETLGAALLDLAEDNLANPWPHPWYVVWRFTHPPLLERLVALESAAESP